MLTLNHLKTFYSALVQKLKRHRGNWKQNDPTADDYIKNRPFYSEITETVILPYTELIATEVELSHTLVEGQTYNIVWDGVTYSCVAREYDGYLMLGNNAIYNYDNGIETDTGEPFALETELNDTIAYIYLPVAPRMLVTDAPSSEVHTVSITTVGELVHKLDKKFVDMPDGIVTEDHLENTLAQVAFDGSYTSLDNKPTIYTDVVRYATTQSLSDGQKTMARNNIGASDFSGNYNDLTDRPLYYDITYSQCGVATSWTSWTSFNPTSTNCLYCNTTLSDFIEGEIYRVEVKSSTYEILYSEEFIATMKAGAAGKVLSIGNASLHRGSLENTSEPIYICLHNNSTQNVTIFLDRVVIPKGKYVYVYKFENDTLKQLDEKFIPDSIARMSDVYSKKETYIDTTETCTITWDGDITGRDSFEMETSSNKYYKVADTLVSASAITSVTQIEGDVSYPVSYWGNGISMLGGVTVVDSAGTYNVVIDAEVGIYIPISVPSAGVYFYGIDPDMDHYVKSATITYKARALPNDVVGVVKSVNGVFPDQDGNLELPDTIATTEYVNSLITGAMEASY